MKNKWELIEENVPKILEKHWPFLNITKTYNVRIDLYRKKKWDGTYKYKHKIR